MKALTLRVILIRKKRLMKMKKKLKKLKMKKKSQSFFSKCFKQQVKLKYQ